MTGRQAGQRHAWAGAGINGRQGKSWNWERAWAGIRAGMSRAQGRLRIGSFMQRCKGESLIVLKKKVEAHRSANTQENDMRGSTRVIKRGEDESTEDTVRVVSTRVIYKR